MILSQSITDWLRSDQAPMPSRSELARYVRSTARELEKIAPGKSVELRVPPFVAVQCIEGLRHRRGTPPNIVELPPRLWLQLACGLISLEEASVQAGVTISGTRAMEISNFLPLALPATMKLGENKLP